MTEPQLSLELPPGPFCEGCALAGPCGRMRTTDACQPLFGDPRYGGLNVMHPDRHDVDAYFAEVRGPGFDDVCVKRDPVVPEFPLKTPQIYPLTSLRGHLDGSFYAIGPEKAIIKRKLLLGADELRETLDIWGNQRLALILFGKDPHMEELWRRRHQIVPEIAAAGYDFVAPPSFSARSNHPPMEYLFNAKRSMIFFEMLQEHGVPTAPRLAWLCDHDVRRAARWCNAQESLTFVTLDLAIKSHPEWRRQLELLRLFDQITDQRLTFLIHGPQALSRMTEPFSILGERLRLTGARAIARNHRSPSNFAAQVRGEEEIARTLAQVGSEAAPAPIPTLRRATEHGVVEAMRAA